MKTCKHPIREGRGYADNFEVIGSHSTDAWGRCKTCGAWWWSVIDDGKFQYEDKWLVSTDLAEAALLRRDPDALARLFVSMDLPKGPVWEFSQSLAEIFRALTPNATDAERATALEAAGAKERWAEAARQMSLDAAADTPDMPLAFDVDLRVPNVTFRECYEVGDAVVLLSAGPELFRLERRGLVQLPLAAEPHFLAGADDRLMLAVANGIVVLDAAGQATSWPMPAPYEVTELDDGWWLFVPKTGETERFVEFHAPDGRPKVKLRRRFAGDSNWMPPPRRFAGGWIVSDLVDDDGKTQALTLFDANFETIAFSEGIVGTRQVTPIDESSFWASMDGTMERWVRRDRALDRAQTFAMRSSWVVGDLLICDTAEGEVIARSLDGRFRWTYKRSTDGATYGTETKRGVLVYDNSRAHLLGADGVVKREFPVESPDVLGGRSGTVYLKAGAELWIVDEDARAIVVGSDASLETTCGDDALLRREDGRCLLVGKEGIRGTFEAKDASFSVVGTRGGPWVIEGDRIRGRFVP